LGKGLAVSLAVAGWAWTQEPLTATLHPSGLIRVARGDVELAAIELSAHGPGWQHAPQKTASVEKTPATEETGKQCAGVLAIPGTEGGSIRYVEHVKPLPQGLLVEYDMTMTKTMKLNGLQFSINLPIAPYAGTEALVSRLEGEPDLVSLPKEQEKGKFQLWMGQGAKVEVAKGTADAVTLELRAATDVVVQDMRQWDNPVFEVRCPAIMEDPGREVSQGEAFHLDVTLTFAAPVRLEGP